jgi:hypothetical protein
MSMVLTFRAGKLAAIGAACAMALAGLTACSREQQDWRSAEASDTVEGYSEFLKDHPDSELVKQARAKLTQLSEDRAWAEAGKADTLAAYNQFLAQYPNGQWSQEARIRVENFELAGAGSGPPPTAMAAAASSEGSSSVAALATGASPQVPAQPTSSQPSVATAASPAQVAPGEAAQLPTSAAAGAVQSPRPPTYPSAATAATSAAPVGSASSAANSAAGNDTAAPPSSSSIASAWRSADLTSYGVQLGAFASENAATGEWQLLVERFNEQLRGLAPHVVSAETATGRLFRLQALVADEATARALCDMLRKQSQACVPVLPH